jgi:hypothetical protein
LENQGDILKRVKKIEKALEGNEKVLPNVRRKPLFHWV